MDLFHFQEEAPGSRVLAPQGLDAVPDADRLHAPPAAEGRLRGGELSRHDGEALLGALGPLGELRREHVHDRAARRARVLLQADELSGPRADLQARAEELSRPAAEDRRVRQGAPLRAVGRAARHAARAPLHAGRRAHLHHRRPDHGRVPEDQRSDARRSTRTSASRTSSSSSRRGPRSASARTSCGTRPRRRHGRGARRDREARRTAASRRRSIRARARSTARSSSTC